MPHDKTRLSLPDLKHLLTAAGLVAGTLGTLLLGAALQVDPHTVASDAAAVITSPPIAGGSLAPPEPAGPRSPAAGEKTPLAAPVPAPELSPADRSADPRRMLDSGNEWTRLRRVGSFASM